QQLQFSPIRHRNPQMPPLTSTSSSARGQPRTTGLNTSSSNSAKRRARWSVEFTSVASQCEEARGTSPSQTRSSRRAFPSAMWPSQAAHLLLIGRIPTATKIIFSSNAPPKIPVICIGETCRQTPRCRSSHSQNRVPAVPTDAPSQLICTGLAARIVLGVNSGTLSFRGRFLPEESAFSCCWFFPVRNYTHRSSNQSSAGLLLSLCSIVSNQFRQ